MTRLPVSADLLPALLVLVIGLAGLTGFGYALAGLTLLHKRTAGLTGLVNLRLLILIGIFGGAGSGLLGVLTANAAAYVVLGIATFRAAEQKARRRGILAKF